MVDAHKETLVVELYLISFNNRRTYEEDNEYDYVGEDDDVDGRHPMINRDDSYWDEVYESNLFDEDNDVVGASMKGQGLKNVRMRRGVVSNIKIMLMNTMRMNIIKVKMMEGLVVLVGQGQLF
ncbi:hypothetical protein SLA2020_442580 [Shorea laevis]